MAVIFEEELGLLLSQGVKVAGIRSQPVPGIVLPLEKLLWQRVCWKSKLKVARCLELPVQEIWTCLLKHNLATKTAKPDILEVSGSPRLSSHALQLQDPMSALKEPQSIAV